MTYNPLQYPDGWNNSSKSIFEYFLLFNAYRKQHLRKQGNTCIMFLLLFSATKLGELSFYTRSCFQCNFCNVYTSVRLFVWTCEFNYILCSFKAMLCELCPALQDERYRFHHKITVTWQSFVKHSSWKDVNLYQSQNKNILASFRLKELFNNSKRINQRLFMLFWLHGMLIHSIDNKSSF